MPDPTPGLNAGASPHDTNSFNTQEYVIIDGGSPSSAPGIDGDLSPEQLAALREGLSSESQMQNAQDMIRLLASQQETFVRDITNGFNTGQDKSGQLPGTAEDILMYKLGLAEANAKMATAGLTPIDTVEGKIKALQFVTNHVVELGKLQPRAKLEAEQLIQTYRELLVSQKSRIKVAWLEAENARLRAEATQAQLLKRLDKETAGFDADLELQSRQSEAGRNRAHVDVDKMNIHTQAERTRLSREERITNRKKENADRKELRHIWWERHGTVVKIAIWGTIILIIVSNIVADQPQYADSPVVSWVNNLWDSIYTPIRDGIVSSFQSLQTR